MRLQLSLPQWFAAVSAALLHVVGQPGDPETQTLPVRPLLDEVQGCA